MGEITIANGVAIGANSVVNKSIHEQNITVAWGSSQKGEQQRIQGVNYRRCRFGQKCEEVT